MDIEKQYSKVRLELMTPSKQSLSILTDRTQLSAYNIELTEKINDTSTLAFSIPYRNPKITNSSCENLVKLGFEHYIIKEINTSDSDTSDRTVTCVHESEELKGVINTPIEVIGVTAQSMFNTIKSSVAVGITKYAWKGTDVPDTTKRSLIAEEERSVFENLIAMAELFEGWIEFSTNIYGEVGVFLRTKAIERNKYIKKGRDLKQLSITYDSNNIFTRLIPFGETDKMGIEVDIKGVNPTGKAYVEDYSYYLSKGMTEAEIKATPKCQQEKIYRNTDIDDANELLRVAKVELSKCCIPELTGSVDIADLSVFEGTAMLPPIVGEKIIVIDQDIDFRMSATISGITRNYDNPLLTKIEITNVIKYDSVFKDLIHSSEKVDKITGTENGKPYVVASHVKGEIDSARASFHGMLDSIDSPEQKLAILFEDRRVGSQTYGA